MPPDDPWGDPPGVEESTGSQAADTPEPEPDPEAPYGYRLDGQPRKSPAGRPRTGYKPPSGAARRKAARERAAGAGGGPQAAPKPPGAARKPAGGGTRRPSAAAYAEGISGFLNAGGGALLGLGSMAGNAALQLDGATLLYHGPPVAQGLGKVCANDPRWGAIADKVLAAGGVAEAAIPLLALGAQLLVNHGSVPAGVGVMFGALPPEELLNRVAVIFGQAPPAPPPAAAPAAA